MMSLKRAAGIGIIAGLTLTAAPAIAQLKGQALLEALTPVSEAMLHNPPAEDWLMWRRTWDTYGFSPLDQINKDNVADLSDAWRVPLGPGSSTPTPLVHDSVMFLLNANDTLLAMDASSGELLWSHQ